MRSDFFDPMFMRRGEDLQRFLLSLLKGKLNKQARDLIGAAAAKHVNELVGEHVLGPEGLHLHSADLEIVKTMRTHGFSMLEPAFTADHITAIERHMAEKTIRFCEDGLDRDTDQYGLIDERPSHARFGHYERQDILSCPEIYKLIHDERLIKIATSYLETPPTISIVHMWWSFPSSDPPKGAQMFHHDRGDFRSCNLFVYLSDVTETTGPHSFVVQTHEMSVLYPLIHQRYKNDSKMYNTFWQWMEEPRKTDQAVHKLFEDDEIKVFTGQRGTSFLEDTRGLHKATVPTTGPRLAFEIVFSTFPKFNETIDPIARDSLNSDAVQKGSETLAPLVQYATRLMYK